MVTLHGPRATGPCRGEHNTPRAQGPPRAPTAPPRLSPSRAHPDRSGIILLPVLFQRPQQTFTRTHGRAGSGAPKRREGERRQQWLTRKRGHKDTGPGKASRQV